MKSYLRTLFLSAALTSPLIAAHDNQDGKEQALAIMGNTFSVQYAPADWKRQHSGWDLKTEIIQTLERIRDPQNVSVKKFQRVIRDFIYSMSDYHVNVRFHSTEMATLPFTIKGANGRYFLSSIDRTLLSPLVFPFNVGDELIAFDGHPIAEAVDQLRLQELDRGNPHTDGLFAEMLFTKRFGALGMEVPKGPVTVKVRSLLTGNASSYQLIWRYSPEKVASIPVEAKAMATHFLEQKTLLSPLADVIGNTEDGMLGSRKSFIPALGKIWWQTDNSNPFHAYLFEGDDHRLIGYIRIKDYIGFDEEVMEFAKIIDFLQEHSEALVIDQVDNPGGIVFYLYSLASMLADEPLITPRHRMSITQADIGEAVQMLPLLESIQSDEQAQSTFGDTLFGTVVTHQMTQFFLNYFRFLIDEWSAGRTLTTPYYLWGVDQINPHPFTRYTKPILLLTNGLDLSGGDFFPAIMQDNKRVVILGTRTAGAGGYVETATFPNHLGIAGYSYTCSIAVRPNDAPIEDLGIEPDILYELTDVDLMTGYSEYRAAIRKAVNNLL
ncbi:MAG: protease-like activity factor CPAF [Chlamydiales bacterium]|nr:protease-like activity factor CPAF [Chlamydiia bacterium]MCP5508101.1 protease-like activity factor CPAF [Chlamydiales bacterium]